MGIACASGPARQVDDSIRSLRSRKGVCARTRVVATPPHELELVACLRNGSPGTQFDNGEARLITTLEADAAPLADLRHWQVIVLRDGEQILNRALHEGPSHRHCRMLGLRCRARVADVAPIPGGIRPGTYTVRYRLMSAEAYLAGVQPPELSIELR